MNDTIGSDDSLQRFVAAQETTYDLAMREISTGHKHSHWMWFIFPQLRGLGQSATSVRYGIRDLAEASSYLAHPVLAPRLLAATAAVLNSNVPPQEMFGKLDAMKFASCMTLFAAAAPSNSIFSTAIKRVGSCGETLRRTQMGEVR